MSILGKKLGKFGLVALLTAGCLEVASFVGGRVLQARGLFYDARLRGDASEYLTIRDPLLGWPPPNKIGTEGTDATGSRIVPAFPDPTAKACATIYGDSFAWAEEVDAEHAWGNVLAKRAGCRVSNFGVGGYGTDQAFMRYERARDDRAPVALLSHLSENVMRNVNRLRNLLSPAVVVGLKPRFVAGPSGEITVLPMPFPKTQEELLAVLDQPEKHLTDEYFLPGGPSGLSRLGFPYTFSIKRLASNYRMRATFEGHAPHAPFYDADHPARGLAVSAGIARAFVKEATSRGAFPGVVLIPLVPDFKDHAKTGKWVYAPLMAELDRAGIAYLNSADGLLKTLGGKDPCSLYVRCAGGHFNEEGYRLLGELVHTWLKEKGKL